VSDHEDGKLDRPGSSRMTGIREAPFGHVGQLS
jgi:hypothetical protein